MPPTLVAFRGMAPAVPASRSIVCLVFALGLVLAIGGCAQRLQRAQVLPGSAPSIAELWQEPVDLEQRDLLHKAGGSGLAPNDTVFQFVARDTSGWSPGFDVKDANGVEWSVKAGPQPAGRFRPELPSRQVVGEWSWYENPFVDSQPYSGLVVA